MSAEDKLSVYLQGCPEGVLCVGGNDLKQLIAWIARIEDKLEAVTKERDDARSDAKYWQEMHAHDAGGLAEKWRQVVAERDELKARLDGLEH